MRLMLMAASFVAALTGAAAAAPVFDWTGFYIGGTAGSTTGTWTLSQYDGRTVGGGFVGTENSRSSAASGVFGVEAGYNKQVTDMFVLGAEGDINATSAGVSPWGFSFDSCGCANTNTAFYGTIRGRAGIVVDRFLVFATAGVAVGLTHYDYYDHGPKPSMDMIGVGPAAGVGVEAQINDQLSVKAEYLHTDFGSPLFNFSNPDFVTTVAAHSDTIRVGLNFHLK